MRREDLDRVHRVGKPKVAEEGSVDPPAPRAIILKLNGHETKMKFMKSRQGLRGKRIFINEDLTKPNHELLLYAKDNRVEGVVVYSIDGTVMARSPTTNRVYRIKKKEDLVRYGLLNSAPEQAHDAEVAE